ncbi:MAG: hypothetical protein HY930_02540 [Euryarchaeota archaeon]|nr:hypothetical protein [Euryarchaeota archaeon]
MEDIIWATRMSLGLINIALLIFLIYHFSKRRSEIPSIFTTGFLLIALALFVRTVLSSPIIRFILFNEERHTIVDPYRLIADVFEFIALGTFVYISTR